MEIKNRDGTITYILPLDPRINEMHWKAYEMVNEEARRRTGITREQQDSYLQNNH